MPGLGLPRVQQMPPATYLVSFRSCIAQDGLPGNLMVFIGCHCSTHAPPALTIFQLCCALRKGSLWLQEQAALLQREGLTYVGASPSFLPSWSRTHLKRVLHPGQRSPAGLNSRCPHRNCSLTHVLLVSFPSLSHFPTCVF